MPIKAKHNGSYKDITDLMNVDESIDYVLAKTSSSYKRVYTATRSIEDAPPTTFKSIKSGANLTDYRIYGQTVDGESVGDRTNNILPMSTTPIDTIIDDFHCEYDGMGTITLTATKDNANFSRFTIPLKEDFIIPISVGQGGNGCLQFNNDKAYFNDNVAVFLLCFNFNNTQIDGWSLTEVNRITYSYIGMGGRTINNISIEKEGQAVLHLSKGDKLTIQPAFYNNGTTEQAPFEPYGYKVPMTVEGKNLLQNTATSQTIDGVTFTVNSDRSVTCNGTANNVVLYEIYSFPRFSGECILSGCPITGGQNTYRLQYTNLRDLSYKDYGTGVNIYQFDEIQYPTSKINIRIEKGYTCDNLTFCPMIRKADIEDDTYEPYHAPVTTPIYLPEQIRKVGDEAEYIDYAEQKQHRARKNLLQNTATSKTVGRDESDPDTYPGVTFTVNADGSVTCNGTANIDAYLPLKYTPNLGTGTFILSGCPVGGSDLTYSLQYTKYILSENATIAMSVEYDDTGSGVTIEQFDYDGFPSSAARIRIASGYTCDNLTFYPMIRLTTIEDDTYEPYIENTEVDVTLPSLPTLVGTNVLSVGTEVLPSKIDITGHIKTISGGS